MTTEKYKEMAKNRQRRDALEKLFRRGYSKEQQKHWLSVHMDKFFDAAELPGEVRNRCMNTLVAAVQQEIDKLDAEFAAM